MNNNLTYFKTFITNIVNLLQTDCSQLVRRLLLKKLVKRSEQYPSNWFLYKNHFESTKLARLQCFQNKIRLFHFIAIFKLAAGNTEGHLQGLDEIKTNSLYKHNRWGSCRNRTLVFNNQDRHF